MAEYLLLFGQGGTLNALLVVPFAHLFFELADKSCIAFFDLGDNAAAEPSPNTPAWVNHIAFKVPSLEALKAMKARLESHGIDVVGITDHEAGHETAAIALRTSRAPADLS